MVETPNGRERVFTLDLGRDWVLKSILGFKQTLSNTDSDLAFIRSLAQGLVLANMDDSNTQYAMRYVALTTGEALARTNVSTIDPIISSDGSTIVLACELVPPA